MIEGVGSAAKALAPALQAHIEAGSPGRWLPSIGGEAALAAAAATVLVLPACSACGVEQVEVRLCAACRWALALCSAGGWGGGAG